MGPTELSAFPLACLVSGGVCLGNITEVTTRLHLLAATSNGGRHYRNMANDQVIYGYLCV